MQHTWTWTSGIVDDDIKLALLRDDGFDRGVNVVGTRDVEFQADYAFVCETHGLRSTS